MAMEYVYILAVMNMTYYKPLDTGYLTVHVSAYEDGVVRVHYPWLESEMMLTQDNDRQWSWEIKPNRTEEDQLVRGGVRLTSSTQLVVQVSRGKLYYTSLAVYSALPLTETSKEFYLSAPGYSPVGMAGTLPVFMVGAGNSSTTMTLYGQDGDQVFTDVIPPNVVKEYSDSDLFSYLTGMRLVSSAPVAVFSGHQCGIIPSHVRYCEPILQQIPSVTHLGSTYVTGPIMLRGRSGYTVWIVVTEQETEVGLDVAISDPESQVDLGNLGAGSRCSFDDSKAKLRCFPPLKPGDYLDFRLHDASEPLAISCSKPCYVYQFNHGGTDYHQEGIKTDPFMALVPPANSPSAAARFSTAGTFHKGNPLTLRNFMNVIVAEHSAVYNDGEQLVTADSRRLGPWVVYSVEVSSGFHEVTTNGTSLAVQLYGHGPGIGFAGHTAYGCPASYPVIGYSNGHDDQTILPLSTGILDSPTVVDVTDADDKYTPSPTAVSSVTGAHGRDAPSPTVPVSLVTGAHGRDTPSPTVPVSSVHTTTGPEQHPCWTTIPGSTPTDHPIEGQAETGINKSLLIAFVVMTVVAATSLIAVAVILRRRHSCTSVSVRGGHYEQPTTYKYDVMKHPMDVPDQYDVMRHDTYGRDVEVERKEPCDDYEMIDEQKYI